MECFTSLRTLSKDVSCILFERNQHFLKIVNLCYTMNQIFFTHLLCVFNWHCTGFNNYVKNSSMCWVLTKKNSNVLPWYNHNGRLSFKKPVIFVIVFVLVSFLFSLSTMGHRMVGLMDLVVWVHILLVSLFLGLGSTTFLCCCGNFPTLCLFVCLAAAKH